MATLIERLLPLPQLDLRDLHRFWSKISNHGKPDCCWEWAGCKLKNRNGGFDYGVFTYNNQNYMAHRVAYFVAYKKDPKQLIVCHSCNNTICVNHNHLHPGNQVENNQQPFDENRNTHQGHFNPRAKLTKKEVLEIRQIYLGDNFNQRQLSLLYGVTRATISHIITRKRWSHI